MAFLETIIDGDEKRTPEPTFSSKSFPKCGKTIDHMLPSLFASETGDEFP